MIIHRAAMNKDIAGIARAIEGGENVNEVDAAGNTPLHFAAWAGDTAVAKALLDSGALINASNNAGDRPWHSAQWLNQRDMMAFLEQHGASAEQGKVIVPDHVPKVRDFFAKACWEHHPLPYEDFMEWRGREDKRIEAERKKLIPF
ncbi:unnamed protein product [Pedinophyceae sp. YPF-701]|nr:unnamed protein product [Pedinophyceae sp. YPF-701]